MIRPKTKLALAALAFVTSASAAIAQDGVIPPPDESHATRTIGQCGARHFDPRLEFCDTRNNHLYRTTTIGSQTWMAENLDYGSMIPGHTDQTVPGQKYCLNDHSAKCAALYQWAQAMAIDARYNHSQALTTDKVQGICPTGWRLPFASDWEEMLAIVRREQGETEEAVSLMAYDTDDDFRWKTNTDPDSMLPIHDRYGFSVIPSGQRVLKGTCPDGPPSDSYFCSAHDMAKFWTADQDLKNPAIAVTITIIEDLPHVMDSAKPEFDKLTADEQKRWIALVNEKAAHQSELQKSYKVGVKLQGAAVRCLKD